MHILDGIFFWPPLVAVMGSFNDLDRNLRDTRWLCTSESEPEKCPVEMDTPSTTVCSGGHGPEMDVIVSLARCLTEA